MKIGFTGTQKGMTQLQRFKFVGVLSKINKEKIIKEFHHGQCIGADAQAHSLVTFYYSAKIYSHRPINTTKKFTMVYDNETIFLCEPKPYLQRNKDIVDETDLLIACPNTKKEVLRSGTWSTVRYARKRKKEVLIIYPDGKCG